MLNSLLDTNFILATDSYKVGHINHLPAGTLRSHSNIVARKPFVDKEHGIEINEVVVLGPQIVAKILGSIRITNAMIDEAEIEITEQGYAFPRAEWEAIRDLGGVDRKGGYLPLVLRAVADGTVLPVGQPIMTVENTVDGFAWLPAYVETWVQDIVWTMSTIASKVRYLRQKVDYFCKVTDTPAEAAEYMIHNFGDRGAGGQDRAIMAAIAHGVFFSGSDSLRTNRYLKTYYKTEGPVLSSVDANEHSTVCANSDCENKDDSAAFEMTLANLEKVVKRTSRGIGVPVQSCLIDTFDDERYIKEFVIPNWPRISEIGGKYVCRPDSGDAVDKPIEVVKWLLEGLEKEHGFCNVNENGIRFLPENIGVIQGDGLKLWDFERIFNIAILENLAASNFVFGFGGGMTNGSTRDDFSFSMKATAIMRADGEWVDMQKSPKTDMGKKSLKGRVGLGNDFCPLYKDGLTLSMTFDKVRERARS